MRAIYVVGGVLLVGMIGWVLLKPKRQDAPPPPPARKDPFADIAGLITGSAGAASTVFTDPGFLAAVGSAGGAIGSGIQGLIGSFGGGAAKPPAKKNFKS